MVRSTLRLTPRHGHHWVFGSTDFSVDDVKQRNTLFYVNDKIWSSSDVFGRFSESWLEHEMLVHVQIGVLFKDPMSHPLCRDSRIIFKSLILRTVLSTFTFCQLQFVLHFRSRQQTLKTGFARHCVQNSACDLCA